MNDEGVYELSFDDDEEVCYTLGLVCTLPNILFMDVL